MTRKPPAGVGGLPPIGYFNPPRYGDGGPGLDASDRQRLRLLEQRRRTPTPHAALGVNAVRALFIIAGLNFVALGVYCFAQAEWTWADLLLTYGGSLLVMLGLGVVAAMLAGWRRR